MLNKSLLRKQPLECDKTSKDCIFCRVNNKVAPSKSFYHLILLEGTDHSIQQKVPIPFIDQFAESPLRAKRLHSLAR